MDTDVMTVLSYPMNLLVICGCFIPIKSYALSHNSRLSPSKSKFLTAYRLLFAALRVINCVRCLGFEAHFFTRFNNQLAFFFQWYVLLCYGSVVYFIDSLMAKFYLPSILDALGHYRDVFGFQKSLRRVCCFSKAATYGLALGVFGATIITNTLFMFSVVSVEKPYFIFPFHDKDGVEFVVGGFLITFLTPLTYLPICGYFILYSVLVEVLALEFEGAHNQAANILNSDLSSDDMQKALMRVRERHQYLCSIVDKVSCLVRLYALDSLAISLSVLFFVIYVLGSGQMSTAQIVNEALIAALNLVWVIFIGLRWGRLPSTASSIIQSMKETSIGDKSTQLLQTVHIFFTECSMTKTGITLYGLCTLDSSTTIMILGTLVTYGIVVLQFQLQKMPTNECLCMCNGSNFHE